MPTFKLVVTVPGISEKDLPVLVKAVQKGGRLLHGDVCLIVGRDPLPTITLYGEELVPENEIVK